MFSMIGWSLHAQNSWSPKANFGGTARSCAVAFSIGNKGYIGTGTDGTTKQDFWEWDVSTNVWTQKANFGGVTRFSAVGFSIGTKGYIGTGTDGSYLYQDFWEYNSSTNTWIQKANFAGGARKEAVGFSINNKGYIGTGRAGTRYNDFYEYDPVVDSWTQKSNFGGTARYGAVSFSIGNKGYIGTGDDVSGLFQNDFWEYNQTTDSWAQKANFGGSVRYYAVGFSIGNKGYIGTGYGGNAYKQDFWEYNSSTDAWVSKTNYLSTVSNSVGFSTCTKGYIGTGSPSNLNYVKSFAEYIPSVTPTASFTASQISFCESGCINFTDNSTNAPTSWSWTFPGGTPSNSPVQNPNNVCFNTAGTYTVTLTASNTKCSSTATQIITVNPIPSVPTITRSGLVLTSSSATNYQWYLNGTIITGATNQSYTVSQNGLYVVKVSNSFGCSASSTTFNIVDVGIEENNNSNNINISPNPNNGIFTIEYLVPITNSKKQIEIFNTVGERVYKSEIKNPKSEIDLSKQPKGIYFINIKTEGEIVSKKIIITK